MPDTRANARRWRSRAKGQTERIAELEKLCERQEAEIQHLLGALDVLRFTIEMTQAQRRAIQ